MTAPGRRVLVASVGLSPQVVTETLHALWSGEGWLPDRLVLMATPRAAEIARAVLLDEETGAIAGWGREWGVAAAADLARTADLVLVETDTGDLDADQGVIGLAETAWRVIGGLAADPATELHVSIAGGRKPAAALMGILMAVLGRPQDRMSHVLVLPDAAASAGLFYPSMRPRPVLAETGAVLDAAELRIILVDIPFPRLAQTPTAADGVRAFFDRLSRDARRPRLVLDLAAGHLRWDGAVLRLPPAIAAFVGWLAREQAIGAPGLPRVGARRCGYIDVYRAIAGDAARLRAEARLPDPLDPEWMEEKAARANRLTLAAGIRLRGARLVQATGNRARALYRLALDRAEIAVIARTGGRA
jgi:CRISPR-associated protein (TIGR02584 family)